MDHVINNAIEDTTNVSKGHHRHLDSQGHFIYQSPNPSDGHAPVLDEEHRHEQRHGFASLVGLAAARPFAPDAVLDPLRLLPDVEPGQEVQDAVGQQDGALWGHCEEDTRDLISYTATEIINQIIIQNH